MCLRGSPLPAGCTPSCSTRVLSVAFFGALEHMLESHCRTHPLSAVATALGCRCIHKNKPLLQGARPDGMKFDSGYLILSLGMLTGLVWFSISERPSGCQCSRGKWPLAFPSPVNNLKMKCATLCCPEVEIDVR